MEFNYQFLVDVESFQAISASYQYFCKGVEDVLHKFVDKVSSELICFNKDFPEVHSVSSAKKS